MWWQLTLAGIVPFAIWLLGCWVLDRSTNNAHEWDALFGMWTLAMIVIMAMSIAATGIGNLFWW